MATRKSQIVTELTADTTNLVRGLNRGKSEAEKYKSVMDRLTGSFKTVLAGIGIGSAVQTLKKMVGVSLEYAESVENMSASTGIAGENIQVLVAAAKASGVEVGALQKHLSQLNSLVYSDEGQKKLKELGIEATTTDEAIQKMVEIFGNASPETLAKGFDVLGQSLAKVVPLYKEISDGGGFNAYKNLTPTVRDEDLKKLKELGETIDELKQKMVTGTATAVAFWYEFFGGEKTTKLAEKASQDIAEMSEKATLHNIKKATDAIQLPDPSTEMSREEYIKKATEATLGKGGVFETGYSAIERQLQKKIEVLQSRMLFMKTSHTEAKVVGAVAGIGPGSMLKNPLLGRALSGTLGSTFGTQADTFKDYTQNDVKIIEGLKAKLKILKDAKSEITGQEIDFGAIYDAMLEPKIQAGQKILDGYYRELEVGKEVYALEKKIADIRALDPSNDPVEIANRAVAIAQARDDLAKVEFDKVQKAQELDDKLYELKEERAKIMSGKGLYEGIDVDEFARVGKIIGPAANVGKEVELDLAKKRTSLLENIDKQISKLNSNTYQ